MIRKHMILAVCLSTILVLFSACHASNGDPEGTVNPGTQTEAGTVEETETEETLTEETVTEEMVTEETVTEEETHIQPELPELDSYQGMTADVPYTLHFFSNGDGTCYVSAIIANLLHEGTYTVEIPETSPDGDTVIGIFPLKSTYNLPRYLSVEDYQELDGWIQAYIDKGIEQGVFENDFELKRFRMCYKLYSTPYLKDDGSALSPLCEYIPLYILDPTTTEIELAYISQLMESAAPWYTANWCYADLLALKSIADSLHVEDEFLEQCLSEHSFHLGNTDAVHIPKTVTQLDGGTLRTLSCLGVSLLTYDGTMEEFKALANMEIPTMGPMAVRCADGELNFPVSERRYPMLEE